MVMMIPPAVVPVIVPVPVMAGHVPFGAISWPVTAARRRPSTGHIDDNLNEAREAHPSTNSGRGPGLLHLRGKILLFHFLTFQDVIVNVIELT